MVLLGDRGSRWRCLVVWMSGTCSLATVTVLARPLAARLWTGPAVASVPLDAVLADLSACVLLGCAAWAWLALTATVLEVWTGAPTSRHRPMCLPDGVRRAVLAACGVALASGASAPAHATGGASHGHRHGAAVLSGLPLPVRAVAPARTSASPTGRTVVVRPGDSLWSIAQRDLPAGASDRAVARHWHAVYATNRGEIGPDPDLIEPGQHLHLPRKDRP